MQRVHLPPHLTAQALQLYWVRAARDARHEDGGGQGGGHDPLHEAGRLGRMTGI